MQGRRTSGLTEQIERSVLGIFRQHKRRYGTRRIVAELKSMGLNAGRERVSGILRKYDLKAIQPKSFVPKTTQSPAAMPKSPNLLIDAGPVNRADQVWVGDITYLPLSGNNWGYLSTWLYLESLYRRMASGFTYEGRTGDQII